MSLGTNNTGIAQSRTGIPTGNYAVLIANRSDFTTLVPTTYGEIDSTIAIAGSNVYQAGYISQETIAAMIDGDKKKNIGAGNQEVNISYAQSIEWVVEQANSWDEKAIQELEDSEIVILVVNPDAITVTAANLNGNATITAGNVYYIFDHAFVQVSVEAKGGENKTAKISSKKTNLGKRYAYLGEGKQVTLS